MRATNINDEIGIIEIAQVETTPISWLFPGRISFGTINLVQGDPGTGKSMVTVDIAARATAGIPMPFSGWATTPISVAFAGLEDSVSTTVRPRLVAAGADLDRIIVLEGAEGSIPDRLDVIEEACVKREIKLLVIDSLDEVLSPGFSPQNNLKIRLALDPLRAMAERHGIAVVIIRHQVKGGRGPAIYRGQGAIALGGRARSVMAVTEHPDDLRLRVLTSVKSNQGPRPPALAFEIVPEGQTSRVNWIEELDQASDVEIGGKRRETLVSVAKKFLEDTLADGPIAAAAAKERADRLGISTPTLRRAREELRVESYRGRGADRGWHWRLPVESTGSDEESAGDRGSTVDRPTPINGKSVDFCMRYTDADYHI